jgi:hypothetical protein
MRETVGFIGSYCIESNWDGSYRVHLTYNTLPVFIFTASLIPYVFESDRSITSHR